MRVEYHFYQDADAPELERLWAEQTDWGQATLQQLNRWFARAPFGKPKIVVAVDGGSGAVVGQFRFMPTLVQVDGVEVSAVRPFGTIVSPELRAGVTSANPFRQPAVAMYQLAVKELRAQGVGLIHMTPDPRWVRLFRMFPFLQCGSFPLWSRPLPLDGATSMPAGYAAAPLAAWDSRVDELWRAASRLHGCSLVRNARTLEWKVGTGEYVVTAVERGGELVGLVASRRKGDRQWLVCDLLAADGGEALRATLAAACEVAHAEAAAAPPERTLNKVALLATPVLAVAARELGFSPDDYTFPAVVHALDASIARDDVAPARWYVSAND